MVAKQALLYARGEAGGWGRFTRLALIAHRSDRDCGAPSLNLWRSLQLDPRRPNAYAAPRAPDFSSAPTITVSPLMATEKAKLIESELFGHWTPAVGRTRVAPRITGSLVRGRERW